jgi:hypothetical protein
MFHEGHHCTVVRAATTSPNLAVDQGLPKLFTLKRSNSHAGPFLFLASHLDNGNNNNSNICRYKRRQKNEPRRHTTTNNSAAEYRDEATYRDKQQCHGVSRRRGQRTATTTATEVTRIQSVIDDAPLERATFDGGRVVGYGRERWQGGSTGGLMSGPPSGPEWTASGPTSGPLVGRRVGR